MPLNTENRSDTRREDWGTPQGLFSALDAEFNFLFDLAATDENSLCAWHCGPGSEVSDFIGSSHGEICDMASRGVDLCDVWCWCNPPYSRECNPVWARKLMEIPSIVVLHQSSPGAVWFKPFWEYADAITFISGRLQFSGAPNKAQFDSVLVAKGDLGKNQMDVMKGFGPTILGSGIIGR